MRESVQSAVRCKVCEEEKDEEESEKKVKTKVTPNIKIAMTVNMTQTPAKVLEKVHDKVMKQSPSVRIKRGTPIQIKQETSSFGVVKKEKVDTVADAKIKTFFDAWKKYRDENPRSRVSLKTFALKGIKNKLMFDKIKGKGSIKAS